MSTTLYAGVARRVINPPIGTGKIGMRLFGDPIQAIESDLTGTVLVLGDGETKLALIATDLCVIHPPAVNALRQKVADALGIPRSHVMFNLSHNHSAPALPDYIPDPPEQKRLKTIYQEKLGAWLVEAATEAAQKLQPTRIGAGWGESHIGIYRREMRDGRDVLGEVPGHPIDPSVGVIRVDDLDGNAMAVVFSYGCHPVTVGPRSMVASTDFPGPARDVVERTLGGTALFVQACGGNINPAVGIGYEIDGRKSKNRVGAMLGGEAVKTAADIQTDVKRGERAPLGNIPNILFAPWLPVEGDTCTYLGAVEQNVTLDYVELPSMAEAQAICDKWQKTLADKRASNAPDWEVRVAVKFARWSETLVDAVRAGNPTTELTGQAFRVNDIVIAGIDMEVFFETGLEIRAQSPFKNTLVLGYTNGSRGYLPRAEDYPPGGWKLNESYAVPDLLFQAYNVPVALHPSSEQRAVQATVDLIKQLQ